MWLTDHKGKRYLDYLQGWAVNCLGHSPLCIQDALSTQAKKLINPSPAFYNAPSIELADLLTENSVFDRVFFANSGAEANEGAIKLARKWGKKNPDSEGQDRFEIITFDHSFHGRTIATMSASGKPGWDTMFAPQVPGFKKAELNDLTSVERLITKKTVAVMLEPVQGEGGVLPAELAYLQAPANCATPTTRCWCSTKCRPAWAAAATCSPTSTTVWCRTFSPAPRAWAAVSRLPRCSPRKPWPSTWWSAPTAPPTAATRVACAVAGAVIDVINTPEVLAGVNAKHDLFKARLEQIGKQYGIFSEVRGLGLLLGCVLSDAWKGKAKDVFNAAEKENLMILQAGPDVVRFAPSLVVEDADINEGLDRFERAVKTLTQA